MALFRRFAEALSRLLVIAQHLPARDQAMAALEQGLGVGEELNLGQELAQSSLEGAAQHQVPVLLAGGPDSDGGTLGGVGAQQLGGLTHQGRLVGGQAGRQGDDLGRGQVPQQAEEIGGEIPRHRAGLEKDVIILARLGGGKPGQTQLGKGPAEGGINQFYSTQRLSFKICIHSKTTNSIGVFGKTKIMENTGP